MRFVAREPADADNVNVTPVHPLKEALVLLVGIGAALLVVLALLFVLADAVAVRISPATEVRTFGGALRGLESSDVRMPELRRIFDELVAAAPETGYTYRLSVIPGEPNAAAAIGGTILVTTGLLDRVRSENELAFVLGHEIGHFAHRDQLRGLSRALVAQLVLGALFGRAASGNAADLLSTAGYVEQLRHSREQERAADRFALELLARRYQHVAGASDFFEGHDAAGAHWATAWSASHPLTSDRLAAIERLAREHGWPLDGPRRALPPVFEREGDRRR